MSTNDFTRYTRFMFLDDNQWECWACGRNHANCGHHIFGRGFDQGVEKSPLNFAPMNNHFCHIPRHGYWMTDEGKKYLLTKTLQYLIKRGYTLRDTDNRFLEKYKLIINRFDIHL